MAMELPGVSQSLTASNAEKGHFLLWFRPDQISANSRYNNNGQLTNQASGQFMKLNRFDRVKLSRLSTISISHFGKFSFFRKDFCASNPCQNDGDCVNGIESAICKCRAGFDGTFCETHINKCSTDPCQNGGRCIGGFQSFECVCPSGWDGELCELKITPTDYCATNYCENNSTCIT